MGEGGLRSDPNGLAERRNRTVDLASFQQRIAEVDARFGKIRCDGDGAANMDDGLVDIALALECETEMVESLRKIWREVDGAAQHGNAVADPALEGMNDTEQIERLGIVRVGGEDALITSPCRIEVAGPMMGGAGLQFGSFVDGRGHCRFDGS